VHPVAAFILCQDNEEAVALAKAFEVCLPYKGIDTKGVEQIQK
jgi:hypothetical protein